MQGTSITLSKPTWFAISVGDEDIDYRLFDEGEADTAFLLSMGEYAKAHWNSQFPEQAWSGEVSYREIDCPPKEWLEKSLETLKQNIDQIQQLYDRHLHYLNRAGQDD